MQHPGLYRSLLVLVLFFSGISALIYQVIWIKDFGLVFGIHVFSITTVLTAFMAGLALGSLLFGRWVDKFRNPLHLFFILELGIGTFAVLFPVLFKGLTHLYADIAVGMESSSQYAIQLVRFALAFVFLLIPTTLMGGTLPVIIKFFVRSLKDLGFRVSNLYSINNLGAVIGAFLAGFILIRAFGSRATLYIGAAINLFNALVVLYISRRKAIRQYVRETFGREETPARQKEEPVASQYPRFVTRLVLWVFAIEGFTTLAYEVIWNRIFLQFSFDKTTYFYTTIIISFIFGLSLGSFIVRKLIDRIRDLLRMLGFVEVLIGLTSLALLLVFARIAPILEESRTMLAPWIATSGKEYLIFFLLLSIPTTLTGMAYPIVSKIYTDNVKLLGNRIGLIGFLDTVGSILGSFVAGFILINFFGVVDSFLAVVAINVIIGLLVLVLHPRLNLNYKLFAPLIVALVTVLLIRQIPNKQYFTWWEKIKYQQTFWAHHFEKLVFYDEGPAGTVTVRQYPTSTDARGLMINGHLSAYTEKKDLIVNSLLGYLPYMLHPGPENAVVIGMGMGVTTYSLIQPDIEEVDMAEICDGVIKAAASAFNKWNKDVVGEPKLNIYDEDGRSLVFMTEKRYDIITSNAIHPRLSNNIYTQDFYEICREKLTGDGIICQWIPPNWIATDEYLSLLKAFTNVFPHSQLWYLNEYSTLVVGSKQPLEIDYELIEKKYKQEKLRRDMEYLGLNEPPALVAYYMMDEHELREFCKDAPVNTDNHPIVEYSQRVSIAPDIYVLQTMAGKKTDFRPIISKAGKSPEETEKILEQIEWYREYREHLIRDIVTNVKRYHGGRIKY